MKTREGTLIGDASSYDLRIALHFETAFNVLYQSEEPIDYIVLPALFMVRQFLELGLKESIRNLSPMSKSKNLVNSLNQTHDLKSLHNSFIEHYQIVTKSQGKLLDSRCLEDLEKLVEKISYFDNNSMGYRYSTNRKGQKLIESNATYNLKPISKLVER